MKLKNEKMKSRRALGPKWKKKKRSSRGNTTVKASGSPLSSLRKKKTIMGNDTALEIPVHSLRSLSSTLKISSTDTTYYTVVDMSKWVKNGGRTCHLTVVQVSLFLALGFNHVLPSKDLIEVNMWTVNISSAHANRQCMGPHFFMCLVCNMRFFTMTGMEERRGLNELRAAQPFKFNYFYTITATDILTWGACVN